MQITQETREKLWAIASRLPFQSKYLIELKKDKKINPSKIFSEKISNYVLELGSGWGEVALELAKRNPNSGYILMEKNRDRMKFTIREIEKYNLENVMLICCNFNWFLTDLYEEKSFNEIILNFPDPWPKMKHWHNRTVDADFLSKLHILLKPKGIFLFATDHGGYGRVALRIFRKSSLFQPVKTEYSFSRKEFPISKFEKEKQVEKKKIYYIERVKIE